MDGTRDGVTNRDGDDALDGLPLETAIERAAGDDDRETVESALRLAADEETVSWEAVEAELATVSKVVATPETRLELATAAVDDAHEAAAGVADEPTVVRRLGALDDRLATVSESVSELAPALSDVADRTGEPGELYGVAADLRQLRERANDQQIAADELIDEAETVEAWLESADRRRREFSSDLDALASTIDGTETALKRLDGDADYGDATGDGDGAAIDAAASHVVSGLLIADLRAELSTLRDWPGDDGVDWEEPADRLDRLATRREALGERVEATAGETVADLEAAVGETEPPVAWERVRAAINDYRPAR
ncbi:hypothetical protein JCM30237_28410 [Halolamina litorea]|uniref:Halo transducer protein n=1 Tax=Halolamina litorea TaxID=1515593 RepID=A0ABD6BUE8_9EURY|nr:hypothetical protein [Halolamina litorea]